MGLLTSLFGKLMPLAKYGLPLVIGIPIGMGINQKLQKPVRFPDYKCKDCICNCPDCPETQSAIDIDKIRGFKNARIDLDVNQHYHVNIDGDSLVMGQFQKIVRQELETFKVKRCK